MQDVAVRLRELFDASGYRSFNDLRDDVLAILGKNFTPTEETIRQMHTPGGTASKRPNPLMVGIFCSLYQKPVAEVSPEVAGVLRVVKSRLGRSIDLRERTSTWHYADGSQDPLPFDQDDVIDLREHILNQTAQNDSQDLYANAS